MERESEGRKSRKMATKARKNRNKRLRWSWKKVYFTGARGSLFAVRAVVYDGATYL